MKYLIFLFVLTTIPSAAQILNAESLRKVTDTSGFSGTASINFALKRNANDFISLSKIYMFSTR